MSLCFKGTGSNLCYMEELKNIEKIKQEEGKMEREEGTPERQGDMVKELL